jgi:hypothetical protein
MVSGIVDKFDVRLVRPSFFIRLEITKYHHDESELTINIQYSKPRNEAIHQINHSQRNFDHKDTIPLHGNFGNCTQWRDLNLFG